jgi:hypothetical protein
MAKAIWQPIETAPRDGTWILLRTRNSVGAPMAPVVAAWRFSPVRLGQGPAWYCAESGHLIAVGASRGHEVDWAPLPDWQTDQEQKP